MSSVTREQYDEALTLLHRQMLGPEAQALLKICQYQIEDAKERLISCEIALVPSLQAQAKRFRELATAITHGLRTRPRTSPEA